MEQQTEFQKVSSLIENAKSYNMLDEIVCSALIEMRDNPNLTPSQAMINAFDEWIK
jgi:hypothetical protein